MRLKRLEIYGFKSFADRTVATLAFLRPATVLVTMPRLASLSSLTTTKICLRLPLRSRRALVALAKQLRLLRLLLPRLRLQRLRLKKKLQNNQISQLIKIEKAVSIDTAFLLIIGAKG